MALKVYYCTSISIPKPLKTYTEKQHSLLGRIRATADLISAKEYFSSSSKSFVQPLSCPLIRKPMMEDVFFLY